MNDLPEMRTRMDKQGLVVSSTGKLQLGTSEEGIFHELSETQIDV